MTYSGNNVTFQINLNISIELCENPGNVSVHYTGYLRYLESGENANYNVIRAVDEFLFKVFEVKDETFIFGCLSCYDSKKRKIGFNTHHWSTCEDTQGDKFYGIFKYNINDLILSLKTYCSLIDRFEENS